MAGKTRIKAKEKKGIVKVMAMAKHDMLSGVEAKKLKTKSNYITYLTAKANGKLVYEVNMSQFLSKNPVIKFQYKGSKGDELEISWVDLEGNKQTDKKKVK